MAIGRYVLVFGPCSLVFDMAVEGLCLEVLISFSPTFRLGLSIIEKEFGTILMVSWAAT
jgi:hypothetical protein